MGVSEPNRFRNKIRGSRLAAGRKVEQAGRS